MKDSKFKFKHVHAHHAILSHPMFHVNMGWGHKSVRAGAVQCKLVHMPRPHPPIFGAGSVNVNTYNMHIIIIIMPGCL